MPRVYDSASNPHDFCRKHFPTEAEALKRFGGRGDGPNGRGNCFGWEAEHSDYADCGYQCETCNIQLSEMDN